MQRLGIFGGTFNPPHKGHIYIACEAMKAAALDKMLFIPCGNPPHKKVAGDVAAKHRFQMTRLAIEGSPNFEITDLEIKDKSPSYTAKTLEKLKVLCPDSKLCFVVGGDSLRDMEGWYHPEKICSLAEIIAVSRGGIEDAVLAEKAEFYRKKYNAQITVITVSPLDISSSDIRQKIADGEDVSDAVEDSVLKYIKENGIYKDSV